MGKIRTLLVKNSERAVIILIVVGTLAIIFLVQQKLSFLNFFFLPVILSGYYLGKRKAVLTAFFCILLVILYLTYAHLLSGQKVPLTTDMILALLTWGSFLILTAAIIGVLSDQRENKIRKMERAYVGVLEIMLKYLEAADEERPRSVRVSLLAGKIAKAAGLEKREVENIKSAALLAAAGDLRASLPLFEEVIRFMNIESETSKVRLGNREQVMLKTTASLLRDVEPLLASYYLHYVEHSASPSKPLAEIPPGSSILALADLYDRISTRGPVRLGDEEIGTLEDISKLAGKSYPEQTIKALHTVVY